MKPIRNTPLNGLAYHDVLASLETIVDMIDIMDTRFSDVLPEAFSAIERATGEHYPHPCNETFEEHRRADPHCTCPDCIEACMGPPAAPGTIGRLPKES